MNKERIPRRKWISYLGCSVAGLMLPPSVKQADTLFMDSLQPMDTYLLKLRLSYPDISRRNHYNERLHAGIGMLPCTVLQKIQFLPGGKILRNWMNSSKTDYVHLPKREQLLFDISAGQYTLDSYLEANQEALSPFGVLSRNKFIGLIATRSPLNICCKYLVYRTTPPGYDWKIPEFVGVALVVDCPKLNDWISTLSQSRYSYIGWSGLPWFAVVSENLMRQLPAGYSGNTSNLNEGRPGIVLVSEDRYRRISAS